MHLIIVQIPVNIRIGTVSRDYGNTPVSLDLRSGNFTIEGWFNDAGMSNTTTSNC